MPQSGQWTKERRPHHLSPEARARMAPHYQRVREAGARIKEECTGKTGDAWKSCRSRVLADVFGKKAPAVIGPRSAPAAKLS